MNSRETILLREQRILAKTQRKNQIVMLALIILLLIFASLSFYIGRYAVSSEETASVLFSKILPGIEKTWEDSVEKIILMVRLPRIVAAVVIGYALAVSGAVYQGVFRNPLVSSDILGASSGAALGAALSIFLGLPTLGIHFVAFVFGLATVIIAYVVGNRMRRDRTLSFILAGVFVSSLCSALVSLLKFVADPTDKLPVITYWLMGSLAKIRVEDISRLIIPIVIGCIPIFIFRWKLNVLSLGDSESESLGVNVKVLRGLLIVSATIVTSSSVATAGVIGWVGLVVPNLARLLVGSDNKILVPASGLLGAIFLLLVDNFARSLSATEIPIGVLTAIVGAPFFLILMMRRED